MADYLISFPRSGNHLVRFFIELLTERPTRGCSGNSNDVPIHMNIFTEKVPFNITNNDFVFEKYHNVPPTPTPTSNNKIILILRNPQEVLIRQLGCQINIAGYNNYFKLIDYFLAHTGQKLLLFYEDIITNRIEFINTLCRFLGIVNIEKKEYCVDNIDKLFRLSHSGEGRAWGGNRSNGEFTFYYKNLDDTFKYEFDNYLSDKLNTPSYKFVKDRYSL